MSHTSRAKFTARPVTAIAREVRAEIIETETGAYDEIGWDREIGWGQPRHYAAPAPAAPAPRWGWEALYYGWFPAIMARGGRFPTDWREFSGWVNPSFYVYHGRRGSAAAVKIADFWMVCDDQGGGWSGECAERASLPAPVRHVVRVLRAG